VSWADDFRTPSSGPKSIDSRSGGLARALERRCFEDRADADIDLGEIVVGDLVHVPAP